MTVSPTASLEKLHIANSPRAAPRFSSRWLDVVSHLDPKYGGLSAVVPELCASIAALNSVSVHLAAFCRPNESVVPQSLTEVPTTYWPAARSEWLRDRDLPLRFRQQVDEADGVHIHGLWEQSTNLAAQTARSLGKPYIISAHGMLDPWALRNKRWKKLVYASFYEHANVRGAACLHALTLSEAEDYRRFGSRSPIAIIPNAVCAPEHFDRSPFLERFAELRGKRLILFLGRIHFKKGLDLLVEAWGAIAKEWPDAHLVLAGPDSEGTRQKVSEHIQRLGVGTQVTFTGMLDYKLKWSALAAAECFVLPSYSEGLSTSVLEAMAAGRPVIVTRECHLPEVAEHGTGWEIGSNADELIHSLTEMLKAPEDGRRRGERGKDLVHQEFSWASVATRMNEVYGWLAGGALPTTVRLLGA